MPFRKSHREIYRQPIDKDKENSADERFPRQCAMLISSSKQDCVLQHCVLLEWTKRQTSTQRRQYGMHSAQGCGMHSAQGCAMIFRRAKGGRQTEPLHVKTKGWYLRAADISLVTRNSPNHREKSRIRINQRQRQALTKADLRRCCPICKLDGLTESW